MPSKKKDPEPVGAGDIGRALKALNDLRLAVGNRDVSAGTTALFLFLDELRQAFSGQPLVYVVGAQGAVAECPDDDKCNWDEAAKAVDALEVKLTSHRAVGDHADASAGLDWLSLLPLILQLVALFRRG